MALKTVWHVVSIVLSNLILLCSALAIMPPAFAANETIVHGNREGRCGKNGVACPQRDTGGGPRPSVAPSGGPGGGDSSNYEDNLARQERNRVRFCEGQKMLLEETKRDLAGYEKELRQAAAEVIRLSQSPVLKMEVADDLAPLARGCPKDKPCQQRSSEREILIRLIHLQMNAREYARGFMYKTNMRIEAIMKNFKNASCAP